MIYPFSQIKNVNHVSGINCQSCIKYVPYPFTSPSSYLPTPHPLNQHHTTTPYYLPPTPTFPSTYTHTTTPRRDHHYDRMWRGGHASVYVKTSMFLISWGILKKILLCTLLCTFSTLFIPPYTQVFFLKINILLQLFFQPLKQSQFSVSMRKHLINIAIMGNAYVPSVFKS